MNINEKLRITKENKYDIFLMIDSIDINHVDKIFEDSDLLNLKEMRILWSIAKNIDNNINSEFNKITLTVQDVRDLAGISSRSYYNEFRQSINDLSVKKIVFKVNGANYVKCNYLKEFQLLDQVGCAEITVSDEVYIYLTTIRQIEYIDHYYSMRIYEYLFNRSNGKNVILNDADCKRLFGTKNVFAETINRVLKPCLDTINTNTCSKFDCQIIKKGKRIEKIIISNGMNNDSTIIDTLRHYSCVRQISLFDQLKNWYGFDIDDLHGAGSYSFEKLLTNLFTKIGYDVTENKGKKYNKQDGVDLFLSDASKTIALQAKRYSTDRFVDKGVLVQLQEGKTIYACSSSIVVTTSYFTDSAMKYAMLFDITLIDRHGLEDLIAHYYLNCKSGYGLNRSQLNSEKLRKLLALR